MSDLTEGTLLEPQVLLGEMRKSRGKGVHHVHCVSQVSSYRVVKDPVIHTTQIDSGVLTLLYSMHFKARDPIKLEH